MNINQFRDYIVKPALAHIGLWSKASERLVIGTALTESRLQYVDQVESSAGDKRPGPAYGFFQMEFATHEDIWMRYLLKNGELQTKLRALMVPGLKPIDQLHGNHYYAAAMCRIFYRRINAALPAEDDLQGMADYWKKYYNTHLGAGRPEDFVKKASIILQL